MNVDKNTGLDLIKEYKESKSEDYKFGALSLPCLTDIPEDDREKYLPEGEVQKGLEDFMDCATRGPINILEAKFNWLISNDKLSAYAIRLLTDVGYLKDGKVTFSDRFVAINSGTTRTGNSLKAPLEAIRKQGLIPKLVLPSSGNMTFNEYHNKEDITENMYEIGKEFSRRFKINYEKVYLDDFSEIAAKEFINVAGYAWPQPNNGVYGKVGYTPNHVFAVYKRMYEIFDNYFDFDGDFIKKLAPDYAFYKYGYRITINENEVKPVKRNCCLRCWSAFKKCLREFN